MRKGKFLLQYDEAKQVIEKMKSELIKKKEASDLFGQEHSDMFKGIIDNIYQTSGMNYIHRVNKRQLNFFVIKNHRLLMMEMD